MASFNIDAKIFLMIFIGAIIAATLIIPIADSVVGQTTTKVGSGIEVARGAVNVSVDIVGRELIQIIDIINTSGVEYSALNYTVDDGISATTGLLSVQITVLDNTTGVAGEPLLLNYTYIPDGYLNNSGARSVNLLIPIFSALAILVFLIVMIYRGSLQNILRGFK